MLTTATKNKINTARDILVGKIPMPTSQVEQITLALTYKFMSDMDKEARKLGDTNGFFANGYEKYAWDKLMDKSLPARDRVKLYGEGLEKMALNPHIPQLFRDIFRNAFLPFNDPETLKLFLDTIDQFEYDHSEELGNAFEYLLQIMGSQGDAGQFRTPRHIIDFIVEVVDPSKTDKILDPACGTAGFLISAYKHLIKKGLKSDEMEKVSDNFVGYDISQDMQRLSLVNMYLHHFPDPHIYEYDSLSSEERWDDDFDVILANPPFMTPKGGIRPHNRFSVPSNRAEVLFVDYIMEHLTINGKAGVIVPEGIIFQSQNAYKKLRKMMVDDDYLWAVVSLPSGVFQPYSGVKTSILLFDRSLAKKTNKVLFIRANNDGYDLGAQRREIKANDLPEALDILKRYKQSIVDGKEIDLEATDMAHVVEKKEIREGEYNLSGDRYISNIKTYVGDYPEVSIEDVGIVKKGSPITKKDTLAGDIPVVAGGQTPAYFHNQSNRSGDVITISASGAYAGFVNYFDSPIFASDCSTIQSINVNRLVTKYLYWILKAKQDFIYSFQQGGGQPHVYPKDICKIKIPLPPVSTQQEIVKELDRYQKIIDGAKQVIDNYQPSFKIEDDWEWKLLGEVSETYSGGTPSRNNDNYWGGEIPWVKTAEVNYQTIKSTEEHITELGLKKSSAKIAEPGTILLALYGQGVTRGRVAILGIKAAMNQACLAIQPKNELNNQFLYFVLKNSYDRLRNMSIGGNQSNLSASLVQQLSIPIPPMKTQLEIVKQLQNEQAIIDQTSSLIGTFEERIKSRIDSIWGITA